MFILDLLTLPVLGLPKMVHLLAGTIADEAERELLDEGRIRASLVELQQRYDSGELAEQDYDRQEETLLEQLNVIRELKSQRSERR